MSKQTFQISPIGKTEQTQNGTQLKIYEPYKPALKELEKFGHVIVLWWCHMADTEKQRQTLECKKPYKTAPETLGIFATRSPARPNPIAVSITTILEINHKEGIITVPWIDAAPDTPIIDLKPYHPSLDRVKNVTMPKWCSHWPKWYEDSANFDWENEGI